MISPAFSFYAKDWLAATITWSLEARGAYMTLLAYQWDAGHIPAGADALARLLGVSPTKARKLWAIIGGKFTPAPDGHFFNYRLELERDKQQQYRAEQAKAGKRGAAKRWGRQPSPHADPTKNSWGQDSSSSSSAEFPKTEIPPPTPPRGLPVRREHREHAKIVLKSRLGYCEHDPACPNQVACTELIAYEIAQKERAS